MFGNLVVQGRGRDTSRLIHDERGMSVMPAMVIAALLSLMLATTLFYRSSSNLTQAGHDRTRQRSIQTAEDGIETWAVRLTQQNQLGLTLPDTGAGDALPPDGFSSTDEERAWVLDHAAAADKSPAPTPEGEWVVVKPPAGDECGPGLPPCVLYSVGYIPSRAQPDQIRIIRVDYDYTINFSSPNAIITDGDLELIGNTTVEEGTGGSIHANGDVTGNGGTLSGSLTAHGDCDAPVVTGDGLGCQADQPLMPAPLVSPRRQHGLSQYDLCPDGKVRRGPSHPDGGGAAPGSPCSGPELSTGNKEYRGWKKKVSSGQVEWTYAGNQIFNGVYYVYAGNANVQGSPGSSGAPWETTIIAESTATGDEKNHCPHTGGDIIFWGTPKVVAHPSTGQVLFVAGRDLRLGGNANTTYEGGSAAHEQFEINGNPSYRGVFIINDYCDTDNSPIHKSRINGNPQIINVPNSTEFPLGDGSVRIVRWLEL